MITNKRQALTFIAMIPLLFILGTANAATASSSELPNAVSNGNVVNVDAKATVLAKGQNHLPKREYDKTTC